MKKESCQGCIRKKKLWLFRDMVQWVKALTAKPDDLSSKPKIHVVERENPLLQAVVL